MIAVDIETSGGFDPPNVGIWQIGAIELENPSNTFLQEGCIGQAQRFEGASKSIIGKTESFLRDKSRQSEMDLIKNFFAWALKAKNKDLLCHNPQFDYSFLRIKANIYGLEFPFRFKAFDLHSIAAVKYFELNGRFHSENDFSAVSSRFIFEFCGLVDDRIQMVDGRVVKEGKPHNGLEDAKMEAESFSRIVYKKGLLEEFKKYKIPKYLTK